MTQEATPVGGEAAPEPTLDERLAAQFGEVQEQEEEEAPAELPEDEGEQPEAEAPAEDEPEIEAEADDLPPIEPPVSWDAEAKETFKNLPREAQEIVAKREGERERFVQQKSQETTRAKQEAEQAALQQLVQIDTGYAQQYQQVAQVLEQLAQEPDYSLLATNPAEFARQAEIAKHYRAQFQQAQRAAEHHMQQARTAEEQAEQAYHAQQRQKIVENFPEYTDPTTGPKLQAELSAVAKEMGYPPELIAQARADDILAMRTAADWKAKAAKYDALMAKQMEKVRGAKKMPKVSKPGVAQAPGAVRQQQFASDRDAMKRGDRDATVRVLDSFFTQQSK